MLSPEPTNTPEPTFTKTPTNTLEPTATSTSTNTPTPTPSPIPALLYEDFAIEITQLKDVEGDNFTVANGILNSKGKFFAIAGDNTWTNYVINIDLPYVAYTKNLAGFRLMLRMQDTANYMAFTIRTINGCGFAWSIFENGKQTILEGTDKDMSRSWTACHGKWRLSVSGNTYTTTKDLEQLLTFSNNRFTNGGIGIFVNTNDTEFRLDSIKVEELP